MCFFKFIPFLQLIFTFRNLCLILWIMRNYRNSRIMLSKMVHKCYNSKNTILSFNLLFNEYNLWYYSIINKKLIFFHWYFHQWNVYQRKYNVRSWSGLSRTESQSCSSKNTEEKLYSSAPVFTQIKQCS